MDQSSALLRVPDYKRFFTVDEMFSKTSALAENRPDLVEHQIIGRSTEGEEIPLVRIGNGDLKLLLYACPHPNEPIGAMLIQFLFEELVSQPSLREGRSWYLIPCIDPDGTRLNEGWFSGPFTVRNYAENYFRPRSEEQVEWTFPIEYKDLNFQNPIRETRALMQAFKIARPQFVYPLHNAGFGGAYYYLSHDIPDVYADLGRIPTERGLPLALGEPEVPWVNELAPAIYELSSITDAYDYLDAHGASSPADLIQGGASSYDHLLSRGSPVMLVTELPYFKSSSISDTASSGRSRREVVLSGIENTRELMTTLDAMLDRTKSEIDPESRFYRTVHSFVQQSLSGLESRESWARNDAEMDAPASVAQEVDATYIASFYDLLVASMLLRALDEHLVHHPSDTLLTARDELQGLVDIQVERLESSLEYSAVTIKQLVEIQYGALLAMLASPDFNEIVR